ncbi:MAG: hypothetical protein ABH886_06885 [Candidatus Desantisbacteria bacterium]
MSEVSTLSLSEDKIRFLEVIAGYENRKVTEIFDELASEYIERHRETLELLRIPDFLKECKEGFAEIKAGGGKIFI